MTTDCTIQEPPGDLDHQHRPRPARRRVPDSLCALVTASLAITALLMGLGLLVQSPASAGPVDCSSLPARIAAHNQEVDQLSAYARSVNASGGATSAQIAQFEAQKAQVNGRGRALEAERAECGRRAGREAEERGRQAAVPRPEWPAAGHADQLPKSGAMPYVPPKSAHGQPKSIRNGGFVDNKGRVWTWDKSRHGGEHWDVVDRSGHHVNVYPNGHVRG
ncbi:hypothetical protein GTV32_04045 [Gordonia sp. SID5947]|uniref:polymorphic toxin type 37 domain-containing protein n=1 Tax=Gordonia sp. SID5947 TaxID=2690315 RepID=UPI001367E276|nr:hypothetical protein [Gordonia sp. SID5947]MYR05533.1 hypothetical protein [Gordonia sp. SID5947]